MEYSHLDMKSKEAYALYGNIEQAKYNARSHLADELIDRLNGISIVEKTADDYNSAA